MRSDLKTLVITMTGLLCHINRMYPVGAKGDELLDCYQANVMSICFVMAVSLLLSKKELWPSALRCPSRPILFLYLALVSAFTVSVSLRMIWLPLTMSLTKSNLWMATKIRTTRSLKKTFLLKTVNLLESRFFHKAEMAVLAFSFLGYALKACGIYGNPNKDQKDNNINFKTGKRCVCKSRVPFACCDSEVSPPFVLKKPPENPKRKEFAPS